MAKSWQRLALETPPRIATIVGLGFTGGQYVTDYHTRKRYYLREDHIVFGINHAALWYKVDICAAMDDLKRDERIDAEYVRGLRDRKIPILTSKAYWEECIEYPLWDVVDDIYGNLVIPPIDNTVTALLAFLIHIKVKQIRCFGLDFCPPEPGTALLKAWQRQRDEYGDVPPWFAFHERKIVQERRDREPGHVSSAFMVGVAGERGISIEIADGSTFLNYDRAMGEPFPNGYQDTRPLNEEYWRRILNEKA